MDRDVMNLIGDRERRVETLLGEFDREILSYKAFAARMHDLICNLLSGADIKIHNVTCRVKDKTSFSKKIARPGKTYTSIGEVTDICGFRITTYFESDVDALKKLIESEFLIDKENSVDKRKLHDPNHFGYMSLHYVISLHEKRGVLPEYAKFRDMKAEVQIRSILQHTWAEIEHDLGYKSKITIPINLQRRFSQLSSLLELADREFLSIRNEMASYEESVLKYLQEEDNEHLVDKNSLKILAQHYGSVCELDRGICKITGARLSLSEDFIEIVAEMLRDEGVDRLVDLKILLKRYGDKIVGFADMWITQREYREFNYGISLMYLVYIKIGFEKTSNEINLFAEKYRRGRHVADFGVRLKDVCSRVPGVRRPPMKD